MKGTEIDNLDRLRGLSQRTRDERRLAAWVNKSDLELTEGGELREKPKPAVIQRPQGIQLPNTGWE